MRARLGGVVLLLVVALPLASCASSSVADGHFAAGRYAQAAAGYAWLLEGEPTAETEARLLFRQALVYALPDSPVRDAQKARQLFERLIERHPRSPQSRSAALILSLEERIEQLASGAFASQVEAEQTSDTLLHQVNTARDAAERGDAQLDRLRYELARTERRAARLQAELAASLEEIENLTAQLEELKKIDSQGTP